MGLRNNVIAAAVAVASIGALAPAAAAGQTGQAHQAHQAHQAGQAQTLPSAAQGHQWRHGVVPLRPGADHLGSNPSPDGMATSGAKGALKAAGTNSLVAYGGGVGGIGVVTGAPKVYLVFWGSQWGSAATNASGYTTLSGDPTGIAPDLQAFFAGLGTDNDLWSGVSTEYCQGVATGATSCPASSAHVGYPSGGALGGVWVDESAAAPAEATMGQLSTEALNAAAHFGMASTSASRDAMYYIVSPTGTHPDGFGTNSGQFCAWHSYATSGSESVAFTNMPYVTDLGGSCGENFVNSGSAGVDDGVTIVGGHEYAETLTDQFPAGGWLDNQGNEVGDKCAWISSGQGASQDITLATGSFAVQSIWANDFGNGTGGCEVSHPIVTNGGGATVSVTSPGNQSTQTGTAASLQIHATDSAGNALTYSATGLPAGLSINSASGLISGTPTTAGSSSVTVTAGDSTGASGSAGFTWTVTSSTGGCTATQLLGNPGFETGSAAPWTASKGVVQLSSAGEPSHSGNYDAVLDGRASAQTATLAQSVSIPTGCSSYPFSFWLHVDTREASTRAIDTLKVEVLSSRGSVLQTLATYSNLNAASGYGQHSFSLAAYAGQTVQLKFVGTQATRTPTTFVIDDTALNVS